MAILSRIEFAEMCDVTTGYINTYISRRKINVLRSDKGKIDTEDPLNVFFVKNLKRNKNKAVEVSRAKKRKKKESPLGLPPTPPAASEIEKVYEDVVIKLEEKAKIMKQVISANEELVAKAQEAESRRVYKEDQYDDEDDMFQWELRKKIADTLKAEKQAEKEALAVDKMMGKLMPTDMVQAILKVNIGHIYKSMESEFINIASVYCDILAGGDRAKLSNLVSEMRDFMQRLVKETEKTSLMEIESVIDEYSESRNRGERK